MMWTATDRYGVTSAPGGLAFIQDLINTRSAGRPTQPDLLTDASTAQKWLGSAIRSWSTTRGLDVETIELTATDLDFLRRLRASVGELIASRDQQETEQALPVVGVTVTPTADGSLTLAPQRGLRRCISGIIAIEIYDAQQSEKWARLKVCRNEACSGAFYDRSRNSAAVWHDARVCGNAVNLRASRARKRASRHERASVAAPCGE